MSRIYPVVLLLGLMLMVAGAATTYVALGQDGETELVEEPATEEVQPTPTLEPTVEPQPVVEQPVQPVVEAPPVQPTVVVPTEVIPPTLVPTEVIPPTLVPTEVIPPTDIPAEVIVEQIEVVVPTEVILPTVVEPVVEAVVLEQTEAVALPANEEVVPADSVVLPEQTEMVAPTEAVIVPEQTEAIMPTEAVIVPEQPEVIVPTEVLPEPTLDPALIPTLPDSGTGQSNAGEVPTLGPENPLEIAPTEAVIMPEQTEAVMPTEILLPTIDPLASPTPDEMMPTEIPAEATEEVVNTGTLIRGSASTAFGQLQGISLTLMQPDGTILETVTDEQGGFVFEGLLPGDYTLSAGVAGALTSQTTVTLTEGQQLELPPAVLAIGDLNLDNQIDMNDVVLLAANYNYPAEVAGVDLNGDSWIDVSDLAILGAQFGAVGPLPWN